VDQFQLRDGSYHCDSLPLNDLGQSVGTPAYIYSKQMLEEHCSALLDAFKNYPTDACFAVKSLSNLSILKTIFAAGLGADLVSAGELQRALLAGAPTNRIVFSGVGKQEDEVRQALKAGILMFNVESPFEIDMIAGLAAAANKTAAISLRINPNIDAQTNAKITTGLYSTKFGLTETDLPDLLNRIRSQPSLQLVGLACHIGSQILDLAPLKEAAQQMASLSKHVRELGFDLRYLNMGGGLGIRYSNEEPPSVTEYAEALIQGVRPTGLRLIIEPGRSLVGNIGVLLTRVISVKKTPERHFVVVDAAMNDLIRPTLYESYHTISAVNATAPNAPAALCDIVGPICESGDFLGKDRQMPLPVAGELLMVRGCGAYGSSMASQYNSRPRAPEVFVDGATFRIIRQRETLESLWANELPGLR